MILISAVILTKNEEDNIGACIKSLEFCDELVVIDDNSTDKTVKIAEALDAKVIGRNLNSDFAAQRNFALEKAQGKWVLFIDADERVSLPLRNEIVQLINNPIFPHVGYYVRRVDNIWGKEFKHGETGAVKLLRLAKKEVGKWRRRVHEVWEVSGPTESLTNPLNHYPHPSLGKFVKEVDYYSGLHAKENEKERKISSIAKIIIWPLGKFVYNWIFRRGFLDKGEGFVLAAMISFNSYLAWSKQWVKQKRTE